VPYFSLACITMVQPAPTAQLNGALDPPPETIKWSISLWSLASGVFKRKPRPRDDISQSLGCQAPENVLKKFPETITETGATGNNFNVADADPDLGEIEAALWTRNLERSGRTPTVSTAHETETSSLQLEPPETSSDGTNPPLAISANNIQLSLKVIKPLAAKQKIQERSQDIAARWKRSTVSPASISYFLKLNSSIPEMRTFSQV
jgi:hypothetical protein